MFLMYNAFLHQMIILFILTLLIYIPITKDLSFISVQRRHYQQVALAAKLV